MYHNIHGLVLPAVFRRDGRFNDFLREFHVRHCTRGKFVRVRMYVRASMIRWSAYAESQVPI